MQTTTAPKKALSAGVPNDRATLVIDLGNGQVKALVKSADSNDFQQIQFPSYVAETQQSNSDCIRVLAGKELKTYLVGEQAADIPMSHTGKDESGKVDNANLLVLHALRLAFGDSKHIHADVVYTTPSNKAYGAAVAEKLEGVHPVTTPHDAEVITSEAISQTITIHKAVAQLEGHYAFKTLNLKRDSWLIDVGNRTIISTLVTPAGRILKRRYFSGVGVRGLAERITTNESLSFLMKEHTPERVIDALFSADGAKAADVIAADISFCLANVLNFIDDDAPRLLIGGGAQVPGLSKALSAKVAKKPQWANITALSTVAPQILEA